MFFARAVMVYSPCPTCFLHFLSARSSVCAINFLLVSQMKRPPDNSHQCSLAILKAQKIQSHNSVIAMQTARSAMAQIDRHDIVVVAAELLEISKGLPPPPDACRGVKLVDVAVVLVVLELELIATILEGVLVFIVVAVVVDIDIDIDVIVEVFETLLLSIDELIEEAEVVVDIVEVIVIGDVALLDIPIPISLVLLAAALLISPMLLLAADASQPPPPPFGGAVHRKSIAASSWNSPMRVLLPPDVVQASLMMFVCVASPFRHEAEQEQSGPVAKCEESQASMGVL